MSDYLFLCYFSHIYSNPTLVDTGASKKSGIVGYYGVAKRNKKLNNRKDVHAEVFTPSKLNLEENTLNDRYVLVFPCIWIHNEYF